MRISFGEQSIVLHSWQIYEELLNDLSQCDAGHIVLGEDAQQYEGFYSARFQTELCASSYFGVGVISEGHGLTPQILLNPVESELGLGFNQEAVFVGTKERAVHCRIQLESLFRTFVHVDKERVLLIIHEIGLIALDHTRKELWRYDKDIIEDCVISNGTIRVCFMDSSPVTLSLHDGNQR